MALGDPILINLSGCTFALSAETGAIIQSHNRGVASKKKDVFNMTTSATIGYVFYDFSANYSWSAIVNGSTGLAIAAPGVVLTLANDLGIGTNKNGVNSGGIYTTSFDCSHGEEDLRMISGNAEQRIGIT
jgi:hypothetical protein